jgi:predicted TIM-barrel fold metal-dependent hydrolase
MPVSQPAQKAPPLSCDCHFHIFGPYERYPLSAGRSYMPPEASVEQYLALAGTVGLERMVVVQPSVYGTDNACTLDAVAQFGRHRAVAVVVIDQGFDAATLRRLDDAGVRGVRFNLVSGNGTPVEQLETVARRIAPLGWHMQVYAQGEQLEALAPILPTLPVEVVLDHMGGVRATLGTSHPQFQALLRLLWSGRVWLKVCSYRVSAGAPWDDPAGNVRAAVREAPDRCVWGTDWPHPGMAPVPDAGKLLDQFLAWVPEAATQRRVLVENPARLYRFG